MTAQRPPVSTRNETTKAIVYEHWDHEDKSAHNEEVHQSSSRSALSALSNLGEQIQAIQNEVKNEEEAVSALLQVE